MRKIITLPGRYFNGLGEPEEVELVDLSTGGCRFRVGERKVTIGTPVQIYVAGTGPHRAIIKWVADGYAGLSFTKPLSQVQFDGFQASHIPDLSAHKAAIEFEEMDGTLPQRFC